MASYDFGLKEQGAHRRAAIRFGESLRRLIACRAPVILSAALCLAAPEAARAQLGALGGVSGIEEGGKIVGPLYTLSGEVGAADAGSLGFYLFYTQVTRSFGKPLDEVYSGNPMERVTFGAFFLNYNLTSTFQLAALAIYEQYDLAVESQGATVRSGAAGISNPVIRAKYQFFSHPYLSVAVAVIPPTGYNDIGSETLDIRGSLALTYKITPKIRLDAEGGYQFAGVWTQGPASNDVKSANIALGWDVGERSSAFLEVNYSFFGFLSVTEPVANGTSIVREARQHRLDVTPGFRVKIKDRLFTTLSAKIGAYNTVYRGYNYFYSLGIDYAF